MRLTTPGAAARLVAPGMVAPGMVVPGMVVAGIVVVGMVVAGMVAPSSAAATPSPRPAPPSVDAQGDAPLPLRALPASAGHVAEIAQHSVRAIAQTADGYLWLGTEAGLLRYDGVTYTHISRRRFPELPSDRIYDLIVSGTKLWIGTDAGVAWWEAGRMHTHHGPRGASAGAALLADGTVVIGQRRRAAVTPTPVAPVLALARATTESMTDPVVSRDGALWVSNSERARLLVVRDATVRALPLADLPEGEGPQWRMKTLRAYGERGVLAADSGGLLVADGQTMRRVGPQGIVVNDALQLEDDTWLVATERVGLLRLDAQWRSLGHVDGLERGQVMRLFRSDDGQVWVGTGNSGMRRLVTPTARALALPAELTGQSVAALTDDADGGVWVSVPCRGVVRMRRGQRTHHVVAGLRNTCVWAVAEQPAGTMWFGTWGGGLHRYDRRARAFTGVWGASESLDSVVLAVHAQGDDPTGDGGALWVGGPRGLYRHERGRFVRVTARGLRHVVHIGADARGRMWVTGGTGLFVQRGDHFYPLSTAPVRDVWFDANGDALLSTYGQGLLRYVGGDVRPVSPTVGVEAAFLGQIFDAGGGDLWISSNSGVLRVDAAVALGRAQAARHRRVHLTRADGLPSTECNGGTGSSGFLTPGGRLYVPTVAGPAVVDLERAAAGETTRPRALVESVHTPRRALDAPRGEVTLAPDERDVQLAFTAFHYDSAHELSFQYRVDSGDWRPTGRGRMVLLAGLDPGPHRVEIEARVPGGVWSDPAAVTLRAQPKWSETWWFWSLVALSLAALVARWVWAAKGRERRIQALVEARTQELAIANAALAEQAQQDALTGLANRRRFESRLELYWGDARRTATPVALIMLDIDAFKTLNDTHGHLAGDRCLEEVARRIDAAVQRSLDLTARYGGEEFAVLLPGIGEAEAAAVAERARQAVERLPIQVYANVAVTVTTSAGVAAMAPRGSDQPAELIARADAALYAAKAAGRNRVVRASERAAEVPAEEAAEDEAVGSAGDAAEAHAVSGDAGGGDETQA